jgi:hypothetical protein
MATLIWLGTALVAGVIIGIFCISVFYFGPHV